MFAIFYFPIISSLASAALSKEIWDTLRDGHIASTSYQVSRFADSCGDEIRAAPSKQLQADLEIVLGLPADAEESYRQAQKLIRTGKHHVHMASSRNTGWQALFRFRFDTAMACFRRLSEEHGVDRTHRLEGMFGVMFVLFQLGSLRAAASALDAIRVELDTPGTPLDQAGDWLDLVRTLQVDLATQHALRTHTQLSDHVYWRSELARETRLPIGPNVDHVAQCRKLLETVSSPLLHARISHLIALHELADGKHAAMDQLNAHLDWATTTGHIVYQKVLREEIALAGIAGSAPHIAETVLSRLAASSRHTQDHQQLEYLYCLSKTRQAQGRNYDASMVYSRYALSAMQCLRDSAQALTHVYRTGQRTEMLDDIAARLPAKYRRGYRYILENLDRSDLSVKEIAAAIGVTERALQTAFKINLGATPRDVIRQRRMERIRSELQGGDAHSERGIRDVANRWGVRHRSSLAIGYKNQYNEFPSDTNKR